MTTPAATLEQEEVLARAALRATQESYWRRRLGDTGLRGYSEDLVDGAAARLAAQVERARSSGDPRAASLAAAQADLARFVAELRADGRPLLQSPTWTQVLERLCGALEAELVARDGALLGRPVVGTLPTGTTNAVTQAVVGADHSVVVLVDDGMFVLANLVAKALARCFPLEADGSFSPREADVRAEVARVPEQTSHRFAEALLALVVAGSAAQATQYLAEPGWDRLSGVLRRASEMFVLAHEYSHAQLGHAHEPRAARTEEPVDGVVVARSWERELEADAAGLPLAVAALVTEGHEHVLATAACLVSLDVQHAVELTLFTVAHGSVAAAQEALRSHYARPGATHPPPPERRARLRESLARAGGEDATAGLVADLFSATVELLTETTLQMALLMRERGSRPDPRWAALLGPLPG